MNIPPSIKSCFPSRPTDSHKGTFGTVLSVCGSYGMAGAAVLAARAATRCGVGLVIASLPDTIYPIAAAQLPEVVFVPRDNRPVREQITALGPSLKKATALLIGCGLGQSPESVRLITALFEQATCPIVLDADGINMAAQHISIAETVTVPLVLTPHPMELARLMHCSIQQIHQDRVTAAITAAKQFGATVVLKGHRTIIADESGCLYVNETGNPGMAVAGSGDVLAGMIASLIAQGLSPQDAARCGVYLHGAAGDRAAARVSQHALLPTDMLEELGGLFLQLES